MTEITLRRGMTMQEVQLAAPKLNVQFHRCGRNHGSELRAEHPLAGRCVFGGARFGSKIAPYHLVRYLKRCWSAEIAAFIIAKAKERRVANG